MKTPFAECLARSVFSFGVLVLCAPTTAAVEYTAASSRDPFFVQQAPAPAQDAQEAGNVDPSKLSVDGLIWDTAKPQAIVNGKLVRERSVIDGAEVISIQKDGVRFQSGNKKFFIRQKVGGKG